MSGYSLYKHTFPNGKVYIGITSQPLEKRFMNGKGYKDCPKMNNAILKYGWANVEHELLLSGLSKQEAEEKEIETIAFYDSVKNGYNTDHGGNVAGTHSVETRQKISAGNKGKKKPPVSDERKRQLSEQNVGENNPFFGRHHSIETRSKHSAFMKGNQYNKGHHHTEEFKAAKSAQMKEKYADGKSPRCKAIIRTDENGEETTYFSLRQAAKEMQRSASALCTAMKKQTTYLGYTWRYAE